MAGNPDNVIAGPGWLSVAPFGTALPTDADTPLISAYLGIGYTEEGSAFQYVPTVSDLEVAEERNAIKTYVTKEVSKVMFKMAEATARNLLLALNGGIDATPTEPVRAPAEGSEQYVTIVLDTLEGARHVYIKAFQTGTVEVARRKAPAKALIPVEFTLYVPSSGASPFDIYPNEDGLI